MKTTFSVELTSITLSESPAGLTRIPLGIVGRWAKGPKTFSIARSDLIAAAENFRTRLNGELLIDYEHASEHPEVAAGGPVPAAGWLRAVDDEPDEKGILWGLSEFTKKAREMIQAGEYKYISPVLIWGARDAKGNPLPGLAFRSIALTNRPVLQAMPAIQLAETGWQLDLTGEEAMENPKVIQLSDVPMKDGRYNFAAIAAGPGVVIASEVFRTQQIQGELDEAMKAGKITPAQRPMWEKIEENKWALKSASLFNS
jgi:hypothetical protein